MLYDVAVVGAGLAGSLSATMLSRAGHSVVLVDPHRVYPPDFRCEKIEGNHLDVLRRTGLADVLHTVATHTDRLSIARFGRLLDVVPFDQYGFRYENLVNAYRRAVPGDVTWRRARVDAIDSGPDVQRLVLSDGNCLKARLAVVSTGLNWSLRQSLGVVREVTSHAHSLCIGFDISPSAGAGDFGFRALQYNPEWRSDRVGYLTLFRIGSAMRANLFVYHAMESPLIAAFRERPKETLDGLMPNLHRQTGAFDIVGPVRIRPTDLSTIEIPNLPGVVLVGDAFMTPCPATGMGSLKAMTDVERLCNVHVGPWLAGGPLCAEAIAAFYADPVKRACDTLALEKAYTLRALSTETGIAWDARRCLRFANRLCQGWMRRARSPGTSGLAAKPWRPMAR